MSALPEFKPPKLTGEAARAAQYVADRADIFRAARALVTAYKWSGGDDDSPYVEDVVAVARFLAGDESPN